MFCKMSRDPLNFKPDPADIAAAPEFATMLKIHREMRETGKRYSSVTSLLTGWLPMCIHGGNITVRGSGVGQRMVVLVKDEGELIGLSMREKSGKTSNTKGRVDNDSDVRGMDQVLLYIVSIFETCALLTLKRAHTDRYHRNNGTIY